MPVPPPSAAGPEPMRHVSATGVQMQHPTPSLRILRSYNHSRHVQRLELSARTLSESDSDLSGEIRPGRRLASSSSSVTPPTSKFDTKCNYWGSIRNLPPDVPLNFNPDRTEFDKVNRLLFAEKMESAVSHERDSAALNGRWTNGRGEAISALQQDRDRLVNGYIPAPEAISPPKTENVTALNALEGKTTAPPRFSNYTTWKTDDAFQNFDGVHFQPDFTERHGRGIQMYQASAQRPPGTTSRIPPNSNSRMSYGGLLPSQEMVYYPAPVPRVLNLPKRLSQFPPRNSSAWLQSSPTSDERSRHSFQHRKSHSSGAHSTGHHSAPQLDLLLHSDSPVETLDNILAASATAPVNAFTDHPFAGDVRDSVYALDETIWRNTMNLDSAARPRMKRSSSIGDLIRRLNTDEGLTALRKSSSRTSVLMDFGQVQEVKAKPSMLRRWKSTLSLGDDLDKLTTDEDEPRAHRSGNLRDPTTMVATNQLAVPDLPSHSIRPALSDPGVLDPEMSDPAMPGYDSQHRHDQHITQPVVDDLEISTQPSNEPPSTLLAELQSRKAQLKSRTRTAATMYPEGMHSSLLQLDAVEAVTAKKQKQISRITLAWEHPTPDTTMIPQQNDNDDVPLGMLFPGSDSSSSITKRYGKGERERPLGLMEKRALEDTEPLSSRRSRLYVIPSIHQHGRSSVNKTQEGLVAADAREERELEDDASNETLAQRSRRVKTKAALDTAIGDFTSDDKTGNHPQPFSEDVLGQFGGVQPIDKSQEPSTTRPPLPPKTPVDETLGQRRARLQREREAVGASPSQQPLSIAAAPLPLQTHSSLASLLTTNPINARGVTSQTNRKVYQPPQGTLLHTSLQQSARRKTQLLDQNSRSASFNPLDPSSRPTPPPPVTAKQTARPIPAPRGVSAGAVLPNQDTSETPKVGLLAAQPNRAPHGGFAGGAYNNGAGGLPLPSANEIITQQQRKHRQSQLQLQQSLNPNTHSYSALTAPMASNVPFYQVPQPTLFSQLTMPATIPMQGYPGYGYGPRQGQPLFPQPTLAVQQHQYPPQGIFVSALPASDTTTSRAAREGDGKHTNLSTPRIGGRVSAMENGFGGIRGGVNGAEAPLHPTQRAAIDRWRMSVMI